MLEPKELIQVREYVIKILPELLRTEPEIATTIEGILAELFPRRDEFARLLDELPTRHEMNNRFVQLETKVDERFEQFETKVDERFEQFETKVDERFEQFETKVDERFEQFETKVDERFERVEKDLNVLKVETRERFDQVDQRFEQVDQRFDNIDRTMLGMRRDVIKLQSGQETLIRRMDGIEDWMSLVTGIVRNEKGRSLEDMVAAGLRYGLKRPEIKAENIRLRQLFTYQGPLTGDEPQDFELDIMIFDDEISAFEVKSTGKVKEVLVFARSIKLLTALYPNKKVRGIFIAPVPGDEVRAACTRLTIELVE